MEQRMPRPWRAWAGTQAKQDCVAQWRARGGDSRRIGGLTDVLQDAAYRDAIGHERDDPHIGTALRTGDRRLLVNACRQHGPEVTGG